MQRTGRGMVQCIREPVVRPAAEWLYVMQLDIHPSQGLGPIKFGMRPADVTNVFPEEEMWEDWMGGNQNGNLLFRGLILTFLPQSSSEPLPDARLVVIVVSGRNDVALFGRPLPVWTQDEAPRWLREAGYEPDMTRQDAIDIPGILRLCFDEAGRICEVVLDEPPSHSPPLQRTGAVGTLARVRRWLGRGPGH